MVGWWLVGSLGMEQESWHVAYQAHTTEQDGQLSTFSDCVPARATATWQAVMTAPPPPHLTSQTSATHCVTGPTCWKRRSSAGSFSMNFLYLSGVVAPARVWEWRAG